MKTRILLAAVAGALLPVCASVLTATPIAGVHQMANVAGDLMPRGGVLFATGPLVELGAAPRAEVPGIDRTGEIGTDRHGAGDPRDSAGRPFDLLRTMPVKYASMMLACGCALMMLSLALGYGGQRRLPYSRTGRVHVLGGRPPLPPLVLAKMPRVTRG